MGIGEGDSFKDIIFTEFVFHSPFTQDVVEGYGFLLALLESLFLVEV
jgi:hypothetical protein